MPNISAQDKAILRQLAQKQLEYSRLDVMQQRTKLWYEHNDLLNNTPLIVMEEYTFENELLPPQRCEGEFARELEHIITRFTCCHERIDDDKVVPGYLPLPIVVKMREFDHVYTLQRPEDKADTVGFQYNHLFESAGEGLEILKRSLYSYDAALNKQRLDAATDALGDIYPVVPQFRGLEWHMTMTYKVVKLMGMESMFIDMATDPDSFHRLMEFITDDIDAYLDWLEDNNLFTANNGNHYVGSGSYGFTHALGNPVPPIKTQNLWGNLNSQESVSISPEMYKEMVYPYYERLAKRFGLTYYGCCEPVDPIWFGCLENLPNLRKVSISAWCNEEIMGPALAGSRVIYSRKPSPNFIGIDTALDEDAFRQHIAKTLACAKGGIVEFIFRDIYTLKGNPDKPRRAVEIVREEIANNWG